MDFGFKQNNMTEMEQNVFFFFIYFYYNIIFYCGLIMTCNNQNHS